MVLTSFNLPLKFTFLDGDHSHSELRETVSLYWTKGVKALLSDLMQFCDTFAYCGCSDTDTKA